MPTTPKHWNYFLAVEAELIACARYIEFSEDNFACYSNELAKLIVLAAAEVDSIFHELCVHLKPRAQAKTINDYYPILVERYPRLVECEIAIPRYQLALQPWKDWTAEQRPDWWSKSYNKLKHERSAYFSNATLGAALNATAAQFLALQLYHHAVHGEHVSVDFSTRSALFETKQHEADQSSMCWSYGDPFAHLEPRDPTANVN
ncbi:hypothetical protein D9M68_484930 [compost metagenome]